jgi:anthranilate synthase/aminodeoxychorismate synthase-like glutamine amidotransferase
MDVLVIDNYDSFTYNIVQEIGELGAQVTVVRNDATTLDEIAEWSPRAIILSPGPGRPEDAGITCSVITRFGPTIPVFGVCLGLQAMGHVFGGAIVSAPAIMHGKVSDVEHEGLGVFAGLPSPLTATRYHSLVIDPATVPDCLEITAQVDGVIMGARHREWPVEGVQFHPESVLTPQGPAMWANFLARR